MNFDTQSKHWQLNKAIKARRLSWSCNAQSSLQKKPFMASNIWQVLLDLRIFDCGKPCVQQHLYCTGIYLLKSRYAGSPSFRGWIRCMARNPCRIRLGNSTIHNNRWAEINIKQIQDSGLEYRCWVLPRPRPCRLRQQQCMLFQESRSSPCYITSQVFYQA